MVGKDEPSVRTIIVIVIQIPRLRRVLLKISMVFMTPRACLSLNGGRRRLLHRHLATLKHFAPRLVNHRVPCDGSFDF
jgi:hypothetical protein